MNHPKWNSFLMSLIPSSFYEVHRDIALGVSDERYRFRGREIPSGRNELCTIALARAFLLSQTPGTAIRSGSSAGKRRRSPPISLTNYALIIPALRPNIELFSALNGDREDGFGLSKGTAARYRDSTAPVKVPPREG
jgi:hypothetical protein